MKRRPGLTALLAGALSATGFEPLHLWPVTLATLALLIHLLWHTPDRRGAFKTGYAFGLGQFVVGLNWIAHAFTFQDTMPHWLGYLAVVLLSFYLAVYPAIAALIGWQLGRGRAGLFATFLACAWLFTEYLRATMFTGFAWNPLGVIWLGTGVDQAASVIGTYGLGLLAMLAGGALWWATHRQWRPAGMLVGGLAVVALLGLIRVSASPSPSTGATAIRVVQPNINQNEKYDPDLEELNFRRLAELTGRSSRTGRLVFWPEAAVPAILDMEPRWRARIAGLLGPDDLLMLGGDKFHYREQGGMIDTSVLEGANNSLWVLDAHERLLGRYDKAHLVPYGEYLPMRPLLSAIGLSRLVPGDVDFWPGPGPRTLDLPAGGGRAPLRMGVQICYEIVFSGQVVDRTHRPDFIFNPSNDAWFGSWGPPQHLAQARLRAIEEGLPVIRSTPTGISALVDPAGRIVDAIGHEHAGAFDALLPAAYAPTLFARGGNLIPLGLAFLMLIGSVAIGRRTR
ncbi:apolipoprotein N-acyltransferase [Sphingobium sp. H33]|uniref:Apolipoprotein N-acyltransferase n=2 Tax=Sphingobium nicotianae TaxID=2782607 RepID=A0A9X1DFV4_9SPHN|nr:apolipoprotein N-acyltransferase [Sphingobium nicotianae]MBT2189144.1 apolipoprotein N-acyltransferase [Sphingobium nicotianae]